MPFVKILFPGQCFGQIKSLLRALYYRRIYALMERRQSEHSCLKARHNLHLLSCTDFQRAVFAVSFLLIS